MAEIRIYDEIGYFGITAASVAAQLDGIHDPQVDVRINSMGGSAFEGVAINSVLARHPARIVVHVDSVAASAASMVAMAGDEILISPYGRMMIHDAAIIAAGNAREIRGMADMIDQLSATIAQMYCDRAGGTVDLWRQRMATDTWYGAGEAVAVGLATRIDDQAPGQPSQLAYAGASAHPRTLAVARARRTRNQRLKG